MRRRIGHMMLSGVGAKPTTSSARPFHFTAPMWQKAQLKADKHFPVVVASGSGKLGLYAPLISESKEVTSPEEMLAWAKDKSEGKTVHFLKIDSETDVSLEEVAQSNCELANETVWGIVHGMLSHHSRNIAGFESPTSLDQAFHMLSGRVFNEEGLSDTARDAKLGWSTLFDCHSRFGVPGMTKPLPPTEQILQRLARTVNVFVIDLVANIGRNVSMKDAKVKYVVNLYDVSKNIKTSVKVETFEAPKVKSLVASMFVPNTISTFVPSPETSEAKLLNFLRLCGPKCPFFVCTAKELGVRSSFAGDTSDAEGYWHSLTKDAPTFSNDVETWTRVKAKARATKAKPTIQKKEDRQQLIQRQKEQPEAAAAAANQTFIQGNNKNSDIGDPEISMKLQEWKNVIYENEARKKREEALADTYKKYLVLDLETTTKKRYKRIANAFTGENFIVLPGLLDYNGKLDIPPHHLTREEPYRLPSLKDYDVIVGHNLKFDLTHLWKDQELKAFFKRGGKIWDTMYAEYLLSGHRVKLGSGAGLEDVAKRRGGKIPKLDKVKQAWANGVETYDIPHELLEEYLIGDLKNTEMIFQQQIKESVTQRQTAIVEARMDGLLCTTEMEFNGLKIDMKCASQQKDALELELNQAQQNLKKHIPKEVPPQYFHHFNWNSNQHLAALFFGGNFKVETRAIESKKLPGRTFARQEVCNPPTPVVSLSPPVKASPAASCILLGGELTADKSTKISKTYLEKLLSETNFRKSAELGELIESDVELEGNGTKSFVASLHKRLVPVYCGVELAADGDVKLLHLMCPTSGKEIAFNIDSDDVTKLQSFFAEVVKENTLEAKAKFDVPLPGLLLIARDASCEVAKRLITHPSLQAFFEVASTFSTTSGEQEQKLPYDLQFVDSSAILEFCIKTMPTFAEVKKATGVDSYKVEAALGAQEWCKMMKDRLQNAAEELFVQDTSEGKESKKLTKRQREKLATKMSIDSKIAEVENIALFQSTHKLSDDEMNRVKLLRLIGRPGATLYDPFTLGGEEPKEVHIPLPGLIDALEIPEEEKVAAMEKFRSPLTKALAVGEESLKWFKSKGVKASEELIAMKKKGKLMGTYYEDNGAGMVSLVHASDSSIHHELIHNKTNTGRLASANPNCQNIPKEDKSNLREMFVSRFENGRCIECDYSQLEVITLCALANDEQMIQDLVNKIDFHCKRVTLMRPEFSYAEVMERAKIKKEPEFVAMRQAAKIFSFQRQYGAGVKTLSESTKLSHEEIQQLIANEREVYKDIDAFTRMVTLSAQVFDSKLQDGARNAGGDVKYKGMFPVITGSRYVFTEQDLPAAFLKPGAKSTAFSPTHIKNYPVQGFAGEIVQIMLGKLWRHFVAAENYKGNAVLTNTVHDCVWVDAKPEVVKEVAADVARIMSSAREVLNATWPEMKCPVEFPVDVVEGANMCHLEPLKY